jgi:hypothetical protein
MGQIRSLHASDSNEGTGHKHAVLAEIFSDFEIAYQRYTSFKVHDNPDAYENSRLTAMRAGKMHS